MYSFLSLQYQMGKITREQVLALAPKWITEAQSEEICGGNIE